MKISEVLQGIKTYDIYEDKEVKFITDDSRKVTEGSIFVCIKGNRFDGHEMAAQMLEKGAVCVVCERNLGLENQIVVENTRKAISLMCANFFGRPSEKLKLIGITGTNGKTTTAFLIKNMLEKIGCKTGLIGTVKNMAGDKEYPAALTTPESFELHSLFNEMVKEGCEYCVMEVSSQALAQYRVEGLHFAAGVFTSFFHHFIEK